MDATSEARLVARRVADQVAVSLGAALSGIYLHGSLVMGDFAPDRSDVDLYLVMSREPVPADVALVADALKAVTRSSPAYEDRIEVEAFTAATLGAADPTGLPLLRVSPGEPCHLFAATRHRVLGWDGARTQAESLLGPEPGVVFPQRDEAELDEVVREIVREWPRWVTEDDRVGFNAYAVLTLCRCWCHLRLGERLSKLRAGLAYGGVSPDDAELTRWAIRWWYRGGTDEEPARTQEVRSFVDGVCAELLAGR